MKQLDGVEGPPKAISLLKSTTATPPRMWEYVLAQVTACSVQESQQNKHERVYNFLHVPHRLERLLFFGYFICLDSFLYNFTILPLRILISLLSLMHVSLCRLFLRRIPKYRLPIFEFDLLKGLLLLIVCLLLQMIDSSRLYHSIRGQSVIKLYVIFNVFEIADRLCCSFGLDILDSFFSKSATSNNPDNGAHFSRLHPILHFILTICYVFSHSVVLFYQAITLNVAINSFSNALLTLLVSNQFVEIKSSVFKKFEKENLFQLSCADILERFQLSLYLIIIGFRNLAEVSSTSLDFTYLVDDLILPLGLVYLSEILVDWLKHAFITKFNHIHPEVYGRYVDILCRDFDQNGSLVDQSPSVSRRIGFSSFPLSCLLIRVILQTISISEISLHSIQYRVLFLYLLLFAIKVILGMRLIAYTRGRFQGQEMRTFKVDPECKLASTSMSSEKAMSLDTIDRYTLYKSRIP